MSRPLSSPMCSITSKTANVDSSYNRMRGTGIGCWFSDRSNCSHWSLTLTFTLTSENLSLYTTLLLLLVLIQLSSHAADILTPTTVVQGVDKSCWLILLSSLYIEITLVYCTNPDNVHCFETIFPNVNFVFASICAARPVNIQSDQYRSCSTVKQRPAVGAAPFIPMESNQK